MRADILIKINNDKRLKEYLDNNSYWYKYLNRGSSYYNDFIDSYKKYKKDERLNKTNNMLDSLDTIGSILKVFK